MRLTDVEKAMLSGDRGEAMRQAMDGLVKLGSAYGAEDMVEIGYAHVHAGMALYLRDVELVEDLAALGAKMAVPTSVNVANADTENWRATGAPESLALLQSRVKTAHGKMGGTCTLTCTPYWAGHWPTWNTHMTSIESTVTIFCNSVLGARSNRDGYFSIYAAITGRYPRFGFHLDDARHGAHLIKISGEFGGTSDFSALGYHVGRLSGDGVPVLDGFAHRPNLDELDALGAGISASGGASMFIVPGVTPPFDDVAKAFRNAPPLHTHSVSPSDIAGVYAQFNLRPDIAPSIVHLGCPHASMEEMRHYAKLLAGKSVSPHLQLWITTSRNVRNIARDEGLLAVLEKAGAMVISDTCPMSCHFARTVSPDPSLGVKPPELQSIVVDSAKQAKYLRDMVSCNPLLTGTEEAVETAVSGAFVPRRSNLRSGT